MSFGRSPTGAGRLAVTGIFACTINWLAAGCHQSLDLLVDSVDAAVTTPADAGSDAPRDAAQDARPGAPPPRVPPDPCTADSDCASVSGVCATDKGICVECASDGQCSRQRQCDPATNQCVGCLSVNDCPSSGGWTCDSLTRECGLSCSSRADCFSPAFSICSESRHVCVMCETDGDCSQFSFISGFTLRCRMGTCGECVTDADCLAPDRPYCDSRIGVCEECGTNAQCPNGASCVPSIPGTDFLRQCQ
jgi:Cys-rich repeat protein